jgi:poly(3-hydroxybutyrate) depolymerase
MELNKMLMFPSHLLFNITKKWNNAQCNPYQSTSYGRYAAATYEIAERLTKIYPKPEFNIFSTEVNGREIKVKQKTVISKPFCNVIHFQKQTRSLKLPKLLIVAPLSGHFATLLRKTVLGLLPTFDVYITDWIDAKHVPTSVGSFDMDDFIDYTIEFMEKLSPDLHVLAVCQPTVPVLAAISLMSSENNPNVPRSMILMGGPIDTRQSPTSVDLFAEERSLNWFKSHLITEVSIGYAGHGRAVYPGIYQLMGFIMMNPKRHIDAHVKLYNTIVEGDEEKAELQRKFYDEYFAVMDMTAEFYLQTIKSVFKDHDLPKGMLFSRNRKVEPAAIKKTSLLGIEGELDDIAGVGQTKAALGLCKNIPAKDKKYHLQPEVGHYGVFSGRRFLSDIVPVINEFVYKRI